MSVCLFFTPAFSGVRVADEQQKTKFGSTYSEHLLYHQTSHPYVASGVRAIRARDYHNTDSRSRIPDRIPDPRILLVICIQIAYRYRLQHDTNTSVPSSLIRSI